LSHHQAFTLITLITKTVLSCWRTKNFFTRSRARSREPWSWWWWWLWWQLRQPSGLRKIQSSDVLGCDSTYTISLSFALSLTSENHSKF